MIDAEANPLAAPAPLGQVACPRGATAFAGSTYDPTSHYRAARVFDFLSDQRLTPGALCASYRRQVELLAASFDALAIPDDIVTRDRETPLERFGAFLALRSTRAAQRQRALAGRGVLTDTRGEWLRLGPAPDLSDAQLEEGVGVLGSVARGSLAPR